MTDTPALPPIESIASMTPEQAGAALRAMDAALHPPPPVVAPADAQDARARLDALTKDAGFANALFNNQPIARRQFDELIAAVVAGDDVADATAGIQETALPLIETTGFGSLPRRAVEATISDWRDLGISDGAIMEGISLSPGSLTDHMKARAFQAQRHSDPDWCKRLLAGDYTAKREHVLLSIILSRPVAEG